MKRKYGFRVFQVVCEADAAELRRRYRARAQADERYPGHLDRALAAEFDFEALCRKHAPLKIGGPLARVDTTNFDAIDLGALLSAIRQAWRGTDGHF